jgi:hypothetical protein
MGIFQLIDYVGVDVSTYIMSVMKPYVKDENIHSPMLDTFLSLGIRGGQFADGSQKDGILKYEKGRPVAIFDPLKKEYKAIDDFRAAVDSKLGEIPAPPAWKSVVGNILKESILSKYFTELKGKSSLGAELSKKYHQKSCAIGKKLVTDNVAFNEKDVNTVLLTGFFHAYGPINNYLD